MFCPFCCFLIWERHLGAMRLISSRASCLSDFSGFFFIFLWWKCYLFYCIKLNMRISLNISSRGLIFLLLVFSFNIFNRYASDLLFFGNSSIFLLSDYCLFISILALLLLWWFLCYTLFLFWFTSAFFIIRISTVLNTFLFKREFESLINYWIFEPCFNFFLETP